MKKFILLFWFVILVFVFFFFRSVEPKKAQDKITVGISLSEVVQSLQSGWVKPYSCSWRIGREKKLIAIRNCNSPDEKFLIGVDAGYKAVVVFKGIGMDYDFEIEFYPTGKVKQISGGLVR